jgi:hypothetical protein
MDSSVEVQLHDHFRTSNPSDQCMNMPRFMVVRVHHEPHATGVETTHALALSIPERAWVFKSRGVPHLFVLCVTRAPERHAGIGARITATQWLRA